jgi:hypothetical protein
MKIQIPQQVFHSRDLEADHEIFGSFIFIDRMVKIKQALIFKNLAYADGDAQGISQRRLMVFYRDAVGEAAYFQQGILQAHQQDFLLVFEEVIEAPGG